MIILQQQQINTCRSDELISYNTTKQTRLKEETKIKVTDYYSNLVYVQDKAPGYVTLLKDELGVTFGDVMGYFTSWTEYLCENEHRYCYPNAHVGEFNPFAKWVSIRKSASRTMRNLELFKDLNLLWDMTFTYPKEVSSQAMTPELVRRCNDCYARILKYIEDEIEPGGKFAASMNTHIWKSEEPLKPHIHHHSLLLDVYFDAQGRMNKIRSNTFLLWDPRTRRSIGTLFNSNIKSKWAEIVNKEFNLSYKVLDVHIEYRDIKKEPQRIVHKLKYNKRTPLPDLANWYLSHDYNANSYDRDYMAELLLYKNKTHNFGYWNRLSKLLCTLGNVEIEKNVHRCPLCGSKAHVVRTWNEKDIPRDYKDIHIDRKGRILEVIK